MSTSEKRAWTEVVIWSVLLGWLLVRCTDGVEVLGQSFGWRIVELGTGTLAATYVVIGVLAAVAQVGVHFFFRSRGEDPEFRDERDRSIETRANQVGYWFGVAALNVIIVHVLVTQAFSRVVPVPMGLSTATGIVFILIAVLVAQEIVRNATRLVLYRRS